MATRSLVWIVILLAALSLWVRHLRPGPELVLRECEPDRQFVLQVYALPDGSHSYTARVAGRTQSGLLTPWDYARLIQFRHRQPMADYQSPVFDDQMHPWGHLEHDGQSETVSFTDWWELSASTRLGQIHRELGAQ
jgi:hypothetical protein